MFTGTSYFKSRAAAVRYYSDYEDDAAGAVETKLAEGSIHIGIPPHKPGDRVFLIDNGTRYVIEERTKMNQIDRALDGLIPIPALAELKSADEKKLLQLIDWLGRWTHEIDGELKARFVAAKV